MRDTPLRAIFFDVDDTLYSTTDFAMRARTAAIENMIRFGFRMAKEDALAELDEVIREFSSNYEAHFDKLLARIPSHYYEGANPAILIAAAVAGYHETKYRELTAYEDVVEVLKLLQRYTDLKLGIITNGITIKQAEKIVRLEVYEYLNPELIFISDQLGVNKPNTKFFQRACRLTGVRPTEAMYVGDHPKLDIDPPNKVGMVSVLSRRGNKYDNDPSETPADYIVHNFWDLLDVIENEFKIDVESARRRDLQKPAQTKP